MTDTATEPTTPAPTATDADENPTVGTDTPEEAQNGAEGENGGGADDDGEPRGRAGRYRERAQAAEARVAEMETQAGELTATVERLQRLHVEQVINAAGVKPAAVFAVAELADLIDDAGLPDTAKVQKAIGAAREQLGVPAPGIVRQQELRSGAGASPPRKNGWASAFAPRDD